MTQARTAKLAVVILCAAVTFVHPSRVQADEPPRMPDAVVTESTPPWSSGDYAYDGSGSLRSIGGNTYVYDTLGRLVSGTVAGGVATQSYTYDGFGNIKTITTTGRPTRTLSVNSATNRLDGTVSGANYIATYDAAGNQISENGNGTRTFDAFNDLAVNSNGVRYIYDANDERIAITDGARAQWRWTVRDMSGRVLREFGESVNGGVSGWTWRKDYVYRESALIGAYVNESGTAKRIHYHLDHLGTPRLTTDSTAVTRQEIEDYPFGEEYTFNVGTTETRHFTGHERDYNSGTLSENGDYLDYMHARYYAPAAGRFLSVDPAGWDPKRPQSWNRYAYVLNNPINKTDPTGRCVWDICVGEATLAVAALTAATAYMVAPSNVVPGKNNGQVMVDTAIGGFQALGRALGNLVPGRQPTTLPPPPPPTTPSRPSTPGTQPTTGVNPSAPIQAHVVNTSHGPVTIPSDYTSRPADNDKGTVYQAPGATGNADSIRVMGPTAAYPNGYVRIYNEHGQPVTIDGKPLGRPETHLPIVPETKEPK